MTRPDMRWIVVTVLWVVLATAGPAVTPAAGGRLSEEEALRKVTALREVKDHIRWLKHRSGGRDCLVIRTEGRPRSRCTGGTPECRWEFRVGDSGAVPASVQYRFFVDAVSGDVLVWDTVDEMCVPYPLWKGRMAVSGGTGTPEER